MGLFDTQNSVTGSRALSTVYHNTTSGPLLVVVACLASGPATIRAICDASSSPATGAAEANWISDRFGTIGAVQVTFCVPEGYYYEVVTVSGSPALSTWTEWGTSTATTTAQSHPARLFGGIYQNTGPSAMLVGVSAVTTDTGSLGAFGDATSTPSTMVAAASTKAAAAHVFFVVPSMGYYRVSTDLGAISETIWVESTFTDVSLFNQVDILASRTSGGNFFNPGPGTRMCSVGSLTSTGTLTARADSSPAPTTPVSLQSSPGGFWRPVFLSVDSTFGYSVTNDASPTLGYWIEWFITPPTIEHASGEMDFSFEIHARMRITTGELTLSCNNPPCGNIGSPYYHKFKATLGHPPYTWSIDLVTPIIYNPGGYVLPSKLPNGLVLNPSTGEVTGTPTGIPNPHPPPSALPEEEFFWLVMTDSHNVSKEVMCWIAVCPEKPCPLFLRCGSPHVGCVGVQYDHAFTFGCGTPPYTFSESGTLPPGLTMPDLPSSPSITGIPTTAGDYSFDLTIHDADGHTITRTCTISICDPPCAVVAGTGSGGPFITGY